MWVKLSNSGDTLRLIIPSYSRKAISGQNNYLGMVTSNKMKETEMGNRGSKSEINNPPFAFVLIFLMKIIIKTKMNFCSYFCSNNK